MHKPTQKRCIEVFAAISINREMEGSEDINLHGENHECMLQTVFDGRYVEVKLEP